MEIISVYIVIALLYSYSFFVNSNRCNNYIYILFFILLFSVAAFRREGVDNDYSLYLGFYNGREIYWGFVEISYTLICYLVYYTFDNFSLVIGIYAAISLLIMSIAIKKIAHFPFVSLLLYTGSYFLLHNMTQIRVACSCAILVLSIPFLVNRSKLNFFILVVLATFFHYSALAMLFLLLIDNSPITRRKQIVMLVIPIGAIILSSFFNLFTLLRLIPLAYVQYKVDGYLYLIENHIAGHDYINVFNSLFLVKLCLFVIMVIKAPFFSQRCKEFPLLLKIYTISIISLPAFAVIPAFATRYNEFFGIVEILLFPLFIYYIKPYRAAITVLLFFPIIVSYIYIFHNEFFKILP